MATLIERRSRLVMHLSVARREVLVLALAASLESAAAYVHMSARSISDA